MEDSFRMPRRLPIAMIVGTGVGIVAGMAGGAMVGAIGVALGMAFGIGIGAIAGRVLDKDERLRAARTRELDAIIGITEGSLGAGPVSLRPSEPPAEAWLEEWLTPPPPVAR